MAARIALVTDDDPTLEDYKAHRMWVAWQTELPEGRDKPTKVPYSPRNWDRHGKTNDKETWGTWAQACARAKQLPKPHKQGGVGVVLGHDDQEGLGGIDLDNCRDAKTGILETWAAEVIERFQSYCEISPSGTGVHLLFRYNVSDLPSLTPLIPNHGRELGSGNHTGLAPYLSNKYFTVTEDRLEDTPKTLRLVSVEDIEWAVTSGTTLKRQTKGKKAKEKGNGKIDRSRDAYVLALNALRADKISTYEEMCKLVRTAPGHIGEWAREQSYRDNEHEMHDMWDNAHKQMERDRETLAKYPPPVPLGYTQDNQFVLLDPTRQIAVSFTSRRLAQAAELFALAPIDYWAARHPSDDEGFSAYTAAQDLIAACKARGPYDPSLIRGRGVWRDSDGVVVNLGGPTPQEGEYQYLCYKPVKLEEDAKVDSERVLEFLRVFRWRHKRDAYLFLGHMAIAPVCGVLKWRPHLWTWGPAKAGKSTLFELDKMMCAPLALNFVGGTSEAGIRQKLQADCMPVFVDEAEKDQPHMPGILRLMRVASSNEDKVVLGTPGGTALEFCVRNTFGLFGVNPADMSVADESRIVMPELMMHDHDKETKAYIEQEMRYFEKQRGKWCSMMVSRAGLLPRAVDLFENAILGDARHRQNMGTLLAGAFIALHGELPTDDDLDEWAEHFASTIRQHAEEQARDDAQECWDHLLGQVVPSAVLTGYPLRHWLRVAIDARNQHTNDVIEARRIVDLYDMRILWPDQENKVGWLCIKNGAVQVSALYANTPWSKRGWMKALRRLSGASATDPMKIDTRAHGKATRAIRIPLSHIPALAAVPREEIEEANRR